MNILLGGIASIMAGTLHLFTVSANHWFVPPIEGVFFIVMGGVQIVLAGMWMKKKEVKLAITLMVVNTGMVMMWLGTRLISAPFMKGVEEFGYLSLVVGGLEIVAIVMLILFLKEKVVKDFVKVVAISLVAGTLLYGGAMASEIIFPGRTIDHGHGGGHHQGTMKEMHDSMEEGHGEMMEGMHDSMMKGGMMMGEMGEGMMKGGMMMDEMGEGMMKEGMMMDEMGEGMMKEGMMTGDMKEQEGEKENSEEEHSHEH